MRRSASDVINLRPWAVMARASSVGLVAGPSAGRSLSA